MSRVILPEPPAELKQLSAELCARLRQEIADSGAISFAQFMEHALYEPGLGYYSAGLHKLGPTGDFVTAPELGTLFAACLARQVAQVAEPFVQYDMLEVGAGTGRLAADLLSSLPPDQLPERYFILERSADLRRVQRERIAADAPDRVDRVAWLDAPPAADWQGILLANEVIDALSAERFRVTEGGIEQMCVTASGSGFDWAFRPAPRDLDQAVRHVEAGLAKPFSAGYRSEIRPRLDAWLRTFTRHMRAGIALFIDYGYPRREYYSPERLDGTLICHYRHQAHDDVFFYPGLQDLTAWVDFTALAEAADASGLEVAGYSNQSMFLLGCGLDIVLTDRIAECSDGGLALSAEARQLTLPGMMGERFQVMGLARDLGPLQPVGFSLQDLRYRL